MRTAIVQSMPDEQTDAGPYGLILAAAFGSLLGRSSRGRTLLKVAPLVLAGILVVYLASALLIGPAGKPDDHCIYSSAHPSDCK